MKCDGRGIFVLIGRSAGLASAAFCLLITAFASFGLLHLHFTDTFDDGYASSTALSASFYSFQTDLSLQIIELVEKSASRKNEKKVKKKLSYKIRFAEP